MRSMVAQVVVLLAVAGGVGVYFASTRPPQLRPPENFNAQFEKPTPADAGAPKGDAGAKVTPPVEPPAVTKPGPEVKAPPKPAPVAEAPKPAPKSEPKPEAKADAKAEAKAAESDYNITLARAKELHAAGSLNGQSLIFVDAREWRDFAEGHIEGAMWLPKKHFDGAAPKKVLNYLPGSAVVVYCGGGDCTDSEAVVKRLIAMNLKIGPIYVFKDGFPAWQKAGFPVNVGGEVGFGQ